MHEKAMNGKIAGRPMPGANASDAAFANLTPEVGAASLCVRSDDPQGNWHGSPPVQRVIVIPYGGY